MKVINKLYEELKSKTKLLNALKVLVVVLIAIDLFVSGRLYQIKKDTIIVNEIQEQFDTLCEKYKDVCENSVYIGGRN